MDQSRPLDGRLAIVTGASRGEHVATGKLKLTTGIGAAIARNLASKGAALLLGYTSDKSATLTEQLVQEIQREFDVQAVAVQADMANENGPEFIVKTAQNHFSHPRNGKFQIDIIVNNAGVARNVAIADETPEGFHQIYNVNVLGPLLLMKAALPYLPHDRSGRIINLSSVSSSLGFDTQSVYGGSKAALEAMTRTWSRELAERATVNAVNPGPVETEMYGNIGEDFEKYAKPFIQNTPLMRARQGIDPDHHIEAEPRTGGRPGYAHEIAGVVGMLCAPESGWCTGSVICANGGMKFST